MKFDWKKFDYFLLFAIAATALALFRPGDIPWLESEAQLMTLALQGNSTEVWAPHGIYGAEGLLRGPLPAWLNQLLLRLSSDPVVTASLKCILSLLLSWCAILWLSRIFRTPAGPGAALFFCSPYLFLYSRMSGDTAWMLPFGMIFAAFAAASFRDGKIRYIAGTAFLSFVMICTYPLSFPIPLTFLAGLLIFRFDQYKREWWKPLLVATCMLLMFFPCLIQYVRSRHSFSTSGAPFTALFGNMRILTAFGFSDRFAPETGLSLSGTLVLLAVPAVAFFIILGVITVIRRYKRKEMTAFDRMAWYGVIAVLLNFAVILLSGNQDGNPGIAFAYLLLAWRGFCAFREDYRRYAELSLGAAMLLQIVFIADFSRQIRTHAGGGSEHYGTTLANQWNVSKNLAAAHKANPQIRVDIKTELFSRSPLRLQILVSLAFLGELPKLPVYSEAVLLPARSGSGLDLILIE